MQIITMYLRADSVNARLVDSYNQTISSLPAMTRGMCAELILKLLDAEGEPLNGDLSAYASWDFVIADDWNTATPPQIRVTEGITVSGNEVHIPLTETNTEELISALGTVESKNFGCELAGFEVGETTPGFLIQFNISIRNRRVEILRFRAKRELSSNLPPKRKNRPEDWSAENFENGGGESAAKPKISALHSYKG